MCVWQDCLLKRKNFAPSVRDAYRISTSQRVAGMLRAQFVEIAMLI